VVILESSGGTIFNAVGGGTIACVAVFYLGAIHIYKDSVVW
jgi:hypothetical protein